MKPEHDPKNEDRFRRYSIDHRSTTESALQEVMRYYNVSPQTHPVVCDLCSGVGGVAKILVEFGWLPENITCIDTFLPTQPLVPNANWEAIELPDVTRYSERPSLTELAKLQKHEGMFDIVTCFQGLSPRGTKEVANLLLKPGNRSIDSEPSLYEIIFTN